VTQQPQLKVIIVMLDEYAAGLPDLVAYFIAPLLTITLSLSAALLLRRGAPRPFAVAAGGRAAPARRGSAQPQVATNET